MEKAKKGRPRTIFWQLIVYDSNYNIIYERHDFVSQKQATYYFYHNNEITHYYKYIIRKFLKESRER